MVYLIGNEATLAIDHRSTSFPGAAASSGVADRNNRKVKIQVYAKRQT